MYTRQRKLQQISLPSCHYSWLAELKLCEPDQSVTLNGPSNTPLDPLNLQQWDLKSMSMPGAWQRNAYGSKYVRVCMVDTGFDYFHPDLAPNVWKNPLETPNNGIDDDNNGESSCDLIIRHTSLPTGSDTSSPTFR